MRQAFATSLVKEAEQNPQVTFLTGDLGFQVFDEFSRKFGSRYINVGVAEAQLINLAAGMAAEGWRPIAYSIASFATARPFEQIRYCISYPNLPVTLIGAGRGFTYSTSGVSHHALDDIGLMTLLPNMTVVIPGDPAEIEELFPQILGCSGPVYFTVGRFGEPRYEAEEAPILGKARLITGGQRIAIISTGEIIHEVLSAVNILHDENINPLLYQMHTIKPLDTVSLSNIAEQVRTILVVEEHVPNGGLWAAITQWNAMRDNPVRLKRLGPPDAFVLGNLNREDVRKKIGCDSQTIVNACRMLWNS